MKPKELKWYMQPADYDDVVVSSRIRLARNLADYDFQEKLGDEAALKMIEKIRSLTPEITGREGMEFYSCVLTNLTGIQKNTLVESHSISPALVSKKQPTGLILSEDESVSIMINEEDHLRIQVVMAGRDLRETYKAADRIDDYLDSRLSYSYSDRYGYLTSCLTNVGTGLRASYMMFLPGLTVSGKLQQLINEVAKYGIAIRGMYGEGTKSAGFLYQVSNQKTLGENEQDIMENLDQIVNQIVAMEHKSRSEWMEKEHDEIEDKVFRSYGVLRYTKSITAKDAMMLLAQLKLGSDMGIIRFNGNGSDIHRLMLEIQPASLQNAAKKTMEKAERDHARAQYLNTHLPNLKSDT